MSSHQQPNSTYMRGVDGTPGQNPFNNLTIDPTTGALALPPRQRLISGGSKYGLKVTVPSAAPATVNTDTAYGSLAQSSTSFDTPNNASQGSTMTSPYGNHPGFIPVPGSGHGNADMYNGPASLSPLSAPSPLSRPLSPHELPPPSPVPSDGGHSSGGLSPAGHSPHGSGHGLSPQQHSPNAVTSTSPNDDTPLTPSGKLRGRSSQRVPQVTIPSNQPPQQPRSAGPYYNRQHLPSGMITKRNDEVGSRFDRRQSIGSRSPSNQPGSLRRYTSASAASSRSHSPYRPSPDPLAQVANASFAGPMGAGLGLNIPYQDLTSGNISSNNLMPLSLEIERAPTPAGSVDEHQSYPYQFPNPNQASAMGDYVLDPNHSQHLLTAPTHSVPSPHQSPFQGTPPISPHDPWSPSGGFPPDTPGEQLGSGAPSPANSNHSDASANQWGGSHHSSPANQVPPGVDPTMGYSNNFNGSVQPPHENVHPTVSSDFGMGDFSFQAPGSFTNNAPGFSTAGGEILSTYQSRESQPSDNPLFMQDVVGAYGGQSSQQTDWSTYQEVSGTQQPVKIENFDPQLESFGTMSAMNPASAMGNGELFNNAAFGPSSLNQNTMSNFNDAALYTQHQPTHDSNNPLNASNMTNPWNASGNLSGFQHQYSQQSPPIMQNTAPVDPSTLLHPNSALSRPKPIRKRSQSASDIRVAMSRQQYVDSMQHMHIDLTEDTMTQAPTFGISNLLPEFYAGGQGPANVRQTKSLNYHQLGHRKSHSGLPSITVTPDGTGHAHYHSGEPFPSYENRRLARPIGPVAARSDPQIPQSGMHSFHAHSPFQSQRTGASTSYAGQQQDVQQAYPSQLQPAFNHTVSFPPPNPNQPLSNAMYSMPNSSAESVQSSPVKPKRQGQRSEVNETLLGQAFMPGSYHHDPALRLLLDIVRASHFYREEEVEPTQGSPEADQISAEIHNLFPDDQRFAARAPTDMQADPSTINAGIRDAQSIYMLFTENNECLICGKKTDRSTRALGHIRSDIGHRPYHCECEKCLTSTNPRSFFSENLLDDHLKGQTHKQVCSICGNDFRRGGLSRHMDSKHPNDPRNPRNMGHQQ